MITALSPAVLRARSVAYAVVARLLGPDVTPLTDPEMISALRTALGAAGETAALGRLDGFVVEDLPGAQVLAGRWVRWFDLGRVAPYEASNLTASAGGDTARLADVAGFYRAFNMAVKGDRPDHVVAQLEFLALTLLAEAEAVERDEVDNADVAARATRSFLRDHVGSWLDAWASRIGEIDELRPWFPLAAAAADLVRTEAASRNVIPLRDAAALRADAGIPDDDEALLNCADEPLDFPS